MMQKPVIMLAAETARSNAYAQALTKAGLCLTSVVLFNDGIGSKQGQAFDTSDNTWPEAPVNIPDLSIPVLDSLRSLSGNLVKINAAHVNEPTVLNAVLDQEPGLVIYSGYGAQIVGEHHLNTGIPYLHLHSGWLPEFRGSTTTYYHLLSEGQCGVSAILLEKDIDTGPILDRRRYPKPPSDLNIDYLYDSAIRADLLVRIVDYYMTKGSLPPPMHQSEDCGNTYYVIHPVLKHIALLSLTNNGMTT